MWHLSRVRPAGWAVPFMFLALCWPSFAQAAEWVSRVSSESLIDGQGPDAFLDRQFELHQWLMAELPGSVFNAPVQVPFSVKDRRAMDNDSRPRPRPERIGVVKNLGRTVKLWHEKSGIRVRPPLGAVQTTADGGFAWAVAINSDNAAALRVRLTHVPASAALDIYFFSLDGQAHGPYRGQEDFWTHSLLGEQGILLVRQFGPPKAGARSISIAIAAVANIAESNTDANFPLCDNNASCIEDATGYLSQPASNLKAATAHMQWVQGAWVYSCSGGLLADTDPFTQVPYFLTANHCLKSNAAARSLELNWNYTTLNGSCAGPIGPMTMGAKVRATGVKGDFTLLELDELPPSGSVFMGWNSSPVASTSGINLHRVHHPKGAPQSYSTHVSDAAFQACAGLPIPQFIYSLDTLGSTEGGSSGSLVTNDAGEVVGQLYGGCGSGQDVCFGTTWRTVDGAFAYYFNKVEEYLAPESCVPAPESCTDGIDNDCDTDVDCNDDDCTGDPACEFSCTPKNSTCSEDNECCSTVCKPNGRCR